MRSLSAIVICIFCTLACENLIPNAPSDDELLDGPITGLSNSQNAQFLLGDAAFSEVFTSTTGLGPHFVSNSCASCHSGDGKGHPSTMLVRYGQTEANGIVDLNSGGPQLQSRCLPGFDPESLPSSSSSMKILAPAVSGLGFLAAVHDSTLVNMADPDDKDNDGISGKVSLIDPPSYFQFQNIHINQSGKTIGRFGKKAAAADLLHQTVSAYNQDMGITSTFEAQDPITHQLNDPEVSDITVQHLVFYLNTLKAPIQRNQSDPQVAAGKNVFTNLNCSGCHRTELKTAKSNIEVLSEKTFAPYTDMLLHDMGPRLSEQVTEGSAELTEWRTAPLWGLGLAKKSQGGNVYLLHDGRARSIEEAILYHGGEAKTSTDSYLKLSPAEKTQLIAFLNSL